MSKFDNSGRRVVVISFLSLEDVPDKLVQLASLVDPGEDRLLAWDESGEQLAWVEYPSTMYAGRVDADGDAVDLPTGWTCAEQAAGQIRVTHDGGLNIDQYHVVITQYDEVDSGHFFWVVNSANYFDVFIRDVDNVAETEAITFHMQVRG